MLTCYRCGTENPGGFRFCGTCGAELAAKAAREVRKTVTALFADVTGSTALGEQLDPEALRRVMSHYFDEMRSVLERHGGTVEKFIGDAVMAVFGMPRLHEDDALRALRAASEMGERLASLNERLEREYGVRVEARTGVNTGEVVAGDAAAGDRLVTGDAVNVAARLEQAAQPGEVLLGEQTRRLVGSAIEAEPVEPLAMKGKAEPMPAYRLLRIVDVVPDFDRRLDAPFVGRGRELERLRSAFRQAVSARRCGLVTVLGPPGIGKSRLARELGTVLAGEATVLVGRCLPYGEGITYWPLREIFAAVEDEESLATALATRGPEEISWSVRKAFEKLARGRPLVLVLEDIHWAEPTLLDLLEHLAQWTRDAPILLLCLARPELLDGRPAWGSGTAQAEVIALDPLSPDESVELIGRLLGPGRLEEETHDRILRVAEGNPLFVEQLLAILAEGGDLEQVPATIHALLAARLDSLSEEERDLVERASVVGVEFEWEALCELDPAGARPPGSRLASLVRKELIRPHELIEDTFRFRHVLIRDAAYERIPKERRSSLHERFAGWLGGGGEEFDEIVGYHLEQAYRCVIDLGPSGDRARALAARAAERLSASGDRAYSRGDMPAAANLLERASVLLPAEDRRRPGVLTSLGRALNEAGRKERAAEVLSKAVEEGRLAGERGAVADASVALSLVRIWMDPQGSGRGEEVARVVEDAIGVFNELGDKAGLARALGVAGLQRYWRGETTAAAGDLERAAQYARDVGDEVQEAHSLRYVLMAALLGPTPVEEALKRVEEIGSRIGVNRRLEVSLLSTRGQLEAMRGRFDESRHLLGRAKALAEDLGLATHIPVGYVDLLSGDAVVAERELRPDCDNLERMGNWSQLASTAPNLVEALHMQGRDEEALELTERWSAERLADPNDVDAQIAWRRTRAKVVARLGNVEEGERLAREATGIAERTDLLDDHALAVADLAEVLGIAGRLEESAAALREAIRLFEEKGNLAKVRTLRGLLAESPEQRLKS